MGSRYRTWDRESEVGPSWNRFWNRESGIEATWNRFWNRKESLCLKQKW